MIAFVTGAGRGSALLSAVEWVEQLLLGSLGTAIAVLAIAAIGFAMLTGRIDVRRGLVVVLGCFILFGARSIATGLQGEAERPSPLALPNLPPIYPKPLPQAQQPSNSPNDPYAEASVPTR